jgi:sulfate permease, SulP family
VVPQALAYALLAGMPPATGLIAAAVATIAAAPFVSSVWLQTGPVAITAMLTFGALATLAEPQSAQYVQLAALLALLVGALRLLIGATRAGVLAYLMSRPVLVGFTPAAALVIAVTQLPEVVGVEVEGRGPLQVIPSLATNLDWDVAAIGFAVMTAAIMLIARRIHVLIPGVLLAAVAGLGLAQLTGYDGHVIGEVPAAIPIPSLALPWGQVATLLVPAAVIALVGFAEPAAIARTYAQETRTTWDADREFVSQGIANVASGLFGSFPVGGSFSRSAVNRSAGATTSWSGLITGVVVLAALPFAGALASLPTAVLAAIIIVAVLGLVRLQPLLDLRSWSGRQFGIALTTFIATIVLAPQIQYGVIIGVVLAVLVHLRRELQVTVPWWLEDRTLHLRPEGVLYFGSAHLLEDQLTDLLGELADVDDAVIHLDRLGRIDVTGALTLRSLIEHFHEADVQITVIDLTPASSRIISRVLGDPDAPCDVEGIAPPTWDGDT